MCQFVLCVCAFALSLDYVCASGVADPVKPLDAKEVDRRICAVLRGPTDAYDEAARLLKNLQAYYEYLDNINDRIDRGWREEANVKVMLDSVGREGPQMVDAPVNATALKTAYEWDDDDVDTMTATVLGIRYMWDQVTKKTGYLKS